MKNIFKLLIIILLFAFCTRQQEQKRLSIFAPKVVEAHGYIVPEDSMAEPKVIAVDESKLTKILADKPEIVPTNINVHIAGKPKVVLAGKPEICTPGQDTFLLPKTVQAIDKPFAAGIPEVVVAKDAYIKDQNPQNFSNFTKLQGLKHNIVHSILQDNSGNLWFCTYGGGVSKYDGKCFTHYTEKEGLSNNYVYSILQDKSGNLWFGTYGGGISKYDGKYFTHYTEKEGLSNNNVSPILQDKSGNLWFGTIGGGVLKFDGKYFTNFTEREGLSNNNVWAILQDKSGNLWFGTDGGISKYDGKCFANYTEKEGLSSNYVSSILQDKRGNLWFGTNSGGVSKYDGKYFTHYTEKEGLSNNYVSSILQDKSGNLWFGTFSGGISKFDGKYFTHYTEKEGLSNNYVYSILQDKSGNLWFGTNVGISKFDGKCFIHYTEKEGLSNNLVLAIIQDKSKNLWFGTYYGGVLKYDGKSFVHYIEKESLSNYLLLSILSDKGGNLWFCTSGGGVSKYDGKFFTHYTEKEGLSNNYVSSIIQDKSGNIWFGTYGGVSKFDGKCFTQYTNKEGLSKNDVTSILQDKSGNIWFGTNGGGVSKYDGNFFTHFTEKEGLSNNNVTSILQDKSGNIWFGTYGGISKYDGIFFTHYTEKEGLSNNYIFSIIQDKTGNLWFGTRFGLSVLKVKSEKLKVKYPELPLFKNYSYEDGFLGIGCSKNAICEDNTGTIWIGANDRLTAYYPGGDEPDTIPPNIQLTGISLFNENIEWANLFSSSGKDRGMVRDTNLILGNGVNIGNFEFDDITRWYGIPENLSLAYNNNYLTFNFIGITTKSPQKVKYQFKLEGLDENWSAITNRSEANYGNLPHGNYTFKVKAMNSEGYWSKEYNYSFSIRPPWWETWWFKTLVIVVIIISLFGLYRWRTASLRKRQKELVTKIRDATIEIRQQKEQIEKIHQEISQSIDYAKRIQTAILPESDLLNLYTSEHFVLFKPKDKVSGDFYWWAVVENQLIITVADCTGHGVPGAFMSMLGTSLLREIVIKEYMTKPSIILKRLRKEIIHTLKQKGVLSEQKDGMDMALIAINTETLELQYAGAYNPLYIISSINNELIEINSDKMPIAIHDFMDNFTNHEYQLQKGDSIYLLSDGFEDQFGGPGNKKFMSKKLKNLLVANSKNNMTEQKQILENTLKDWIGSGDQIDDITIVGIKL